MNEKIRILHLITDLDTGGAEITLHSLISNANRERFDVEVVSLTSVGAVGGKIKELGVKVGALGMKRGAPDPRAVIRLAGLIRDRRPDLIQSWMYHADFAGSLAVKLAKGVPIVWGIRNSTLDPRESKGMTILTVKICARLSRKSPARIVCCSEASRSVHAGIGYAKDKMVVIPNGFDLDAFRPDEEARGSVRAELGIPAGAPLAGLVARFDPQKDHRNFVEAAAILSSRMPGVHFLLCGSGVTEENDELMRRIKGTGRPDRFHLLGRRSDVPRLQAALDVAVLSSSFGEAFPRVIGEAMSCGVPCAVTDVGDSAIIVGETGRVAPPKAPEALADAMAEILGFSPEERAELGAAARRRIEDNYSIGHITEKYEKLYLDVINERKS